MSGGLAPSHLAKSDARGVAVVGLELCGIAAAFGVDRIIGSWWVYPLTVLVIGTRQYALAEAMTHEAAHYNLCASRRLNEVLGILTTWPFFYVLSGYRRYHLEHHRVGLGDPENNIREQYAFWGLPGEHEPLGPRRARWLFVLRPALGLMALYHVRTIASNLYWDRDLPESWLMLAAWSAVLAIAWHQGWMAQLLAYWIVPQLLVVGTLDYWSETSDHYRVSGALTRSDLNPWLNRLVSHNIGYHALHHRFPAIPWFRLPAAHAALGGALAEQRSSGLRESITQMADG